MFMFDETSSQGGSFHPLFQIIICFMIQSVLEQCPSARLISSQSLLFARVLFIVMLHKDAEKLFENPGNVSFLKSWKDELQHKITNHVKAKTGELVVSPFILRKVQETQRSVLHKPRDSFYNVTIQYIIAYILDNRKLYTHPSSGALALFLGPKGAPCLLCMLALHVAALLQGRTCTAASCRV